MTERTMYGLGAVVKEYVFLFLGGIVLSSFLFLILDVQLGKKRKNQFIAKDKV